MRKLGLLLPLFLPLSALAQFVPGKSIKEYTTKMGTTFHPGDSLVFALGTRENGAFKYAAVPPGHLLAPDGMPLAASWNNRKAAIKDIRLIPFKSGPKVSLVFKSGAFNATVDADAAEQAGEIVTPHNQRPAPAGSVADELIKLKGLLDAGVITQAEFDAQKAKLLGNK